MIQPKNWESLDDAPQWFWILFFLSTVAVAFTVGFLWNWTPA